MSYGKSITINRIFSDLHNWDAFLFKHKDSLRAVEVVEVEKMLLCQDKMSGYFVFHCQKCDVDKVVHLGCNSRVCTHCGKHFTDRWADMVAKGMMNVVHRHCVFTIPDVLWPIFKKNRRLLKELIDCCIRAVAKMFMQKMGKNIKPGVVAVLHTFGKDMKFNAHVHCLVTEGGMQENGAWIDINFFPFELLRKYWQYEVLLMLKENLPDTKENRDLIDAQFIEHTEGFYVRAVDRIKSKRELVRYIGRYIRHPAIAESRIDSYDGKYVTFHYTDNLDVIHKVVMTVEEFITAIIGHIPDRQFKIIRYYGIYARKDRKKYRELMNGCAYYGSIIQTTLTKFLHRMIIHCDKCHGLMDFVWYEPRRPPDKSIFGAQIKDWQYIS